VIDAPNGPRSLKGKRVFACALLAVFLLGARATPSPPPSPIPDDDPQAAQIFHAARVGWNTGDYPRYATYVVDVAYTRSDTKKNDTKPIVRHYDTYEDLRRNLVFARVFSREEEAHPYLPPPGTVFVVNGKALNRKAPDDPLGSFAIGINNDYGIALDSKPITTVSSSVDAAQSSSLIVIGRTGTAQRTYALRMIDTLDDADGRTYHVGLTPLRDPQRNRLRELWVDAKTSVVKRVLVSANFNRDPLNRVAWLIEYHIVDGAPYIARESAQGPLDCGHGLVAEGVIVSFEDFKQLSIVPLNLSIGISTPADVTDKP
jgi:hypothetical protein